MKKLSNGTVIISKKGTEDLRNKTDDMLKLIKDGHSMEASLLGIKGIKHND